jgi:hypothetical protein
MKRYAFSITLGIVCFVGGYVACYSKATLAQHVRESQRQQEENRYLSLVIARFLESKRAADAVLRAYCEAKDPPAKPKAEAWDLGFIAPMNPPKRVAP